MRYIQVTKFDNGDQPTYTINQEKPVFIEQHPNDLLLHTYAWIADQDTGEILKKDHLILRNVDTDTYCVGSYTFK